MKRYQSDTKAFTWFIVDDNEHAVDISDVIAATFAYRKDADTLITISGTTVDSVAGEIEFTVLNTDFDTAGNYVYNVLLTYDTSETLTVAQGDLLVVETVN